MRKNVISTSIFLVYGDMGVKGMKIRLCIKYLMYYNNDIVHISNHTPILPLLAIHTTHTTI
jgi:hypothetical protein